MALMVPPSPPLWRPGWFAEKNLFEALRAGLPDEFHVFHDYAYLGSVQPREGAIDFLVVHRELGLLAIECTGDGVHLRGDGSWMRVAAGGREEPLDESPFRQVQRHIKELVEELRPKIAHLFPELGGGFPFVYGHAVAFPVRRRRPPRPPARGGLAADRPLRRGPDPPRHARPGDSRVLGARPPARPRARRAPVHPVPQARPAPPLATRPDLWRAPGAGKPGDRPAERRAGRGAPQRGRRPAPVRPRRRRQRQDPACPRAGARGGARGPAGPADLLQHRPRSVDRRDRRRVGPAGRPDPGGDVSRPLSRGRGEQRRHPGPAGARRQAGRRGVLERADAGAAPGGAAKPGGCPATTPSSSTRVRTFTGAGSTCSSGSCATRARGRSSSSTTRPRTSSAPAAAFPRTPPPSSASISATRAASPVSCAGSPRAPPPRSRATPRARRRSSTRNRTALRPRPAPSTGSSTNSSTRSRSLPGGSPSSPRRPGRTPVSAASTSSAASASPPTL